MPNRPPAAKAPFFIPFHVSEAIPSKDFSNQSAIILITPYATKSAIILGICAVKFSSKAPESLAPAASAKPAINTVPIDNEITKNGYKIA